MRDPAFLSAIIVALIVSCVAPLLMGWVSGERKKTAVLEATAKAKQERDQEAADRRADKQQDWAREDIVAERVEQAAKDLAAANAGFANQLKVIDDQGKINHILLNSNMTRAMQAELDAKRLLLLALRRLAGSDTEAEEDAALILVTEAKVAELEKDLAERAVQQKTVDAELAKQAAARLHL